MTNQFRHAELARKYWAEPEKWEWRAKYGHHCTEWIHSTMPEFWSVNDYELRERVPPVKLMRYEGTFPEPLRTAPSFGVEVFIIFLDKIINEVWNSNSGWSPWLEAGFVHPTREAAEQHLAVLREMKEAM